MTLEFSLIIDLPNIGTLQINNTPQKQDKFIENKNEFGNIGTCSIVRNPQYIASRI